MVYISYINKTQEKYMNAELKKLINGYKNKIEKSANIEEVISILKTDFPDLINDKNVEVVKNYILKEFNF
jgi:hypothetical protein